MTTDFETLDRLLRRVHAPVDAGECHGALCGALCAPGGDADAWLDAVLDGVDAAPAREARKELAALGAAVHRQLRDGDMAFAPLLPDDGKPLPERTGALAEWCEGFLFGLGNARIRDFDALPPGTQEVVRDAIEIARVGIPAGDDEEDEEAFTELVEYLRVGVQLVYDELNPAPAPAQVAAPRSIH